jgi:hypothetical protein
MHKCAMANSDSWRDFAVRFQALSSPHADVRGTWQHTVGSGVVGDWRFGGDDALRAQFEALARRAASGLPVKRSSDLLIAWLEALRGDGRDFRFWDSLPSGYLIGNIDRVCEASANFCRKLESEALQLEFNEKQRATTPVVQAQTATRFRPLDESYQTIEFEDRQYELTPTQSTIIRVLHTAHTEKLGSVGIKEIQKALGVHSGRMSQWFRGKNKSLYGKLIVQTAGRYHYRLDL